MINFMLGAPGGGKSYEAVVYHVMNALRKGRKVITNLPLNLEYIEALEPGASDLVELKHPTKDNPIPFRTKTDYGDEWRHLETGIGPLYVIDEAHKAFGKGIALREVEEWFAEHRHEKADVLVLTQSYGKISRPIVDLVQIVYRVRKAVALGTTKHYIRKVQDGIRGEELSATIRKYEKKYFPLYQSHTQTDSQGEEAGTVDAPNIWTKWPFVGAALMLIIAIYLGINGHLTPTFMKTEQAGGQKTEQQDGPPKMVRYETVQGVPKRIEDYPPTSSGLPVAQQHIQPPEPEEPPAPQIPWSEDQLHVQGSIQSAERQIVGISVSQNGQQVYTITDEDMRQAGWEVELVASCALRMTYEDYQRIITCDAPKQTVRVGGKGGNPAPRGGSLTAHAVPVKNPTGERGTVVYSGWN